MNRRLFLALSSASLVVAPGSAQGDDKIRFDGTWWKDQPSSVKFGYVLGYADGSDKADATWADGQCKIFVSKKYSAVVQAGNNYSGIGFDQLVSGVTEFYKDFRNTRIRTQDAMMVVKMQISGTGEKDVEETLQVLRQGALDHRY